MKYIRYRGPGTTLRGVLGEVQGEATPGDITQRKRALQQTRGSGEEFPKLWLPEGGERVPLFRVRMTGHKGEFCHPR